MLTPAPERQRPARPGRAIRQGPAADPHILRPPGSSDIFLRGIVRRSIFRRGVLPGIHLSGRSRLISSG